MKPHPLHTDMQAWPRAEHGRSLVLGALVLAISSTIVVPTLLAAEGEDTPAAPETAPAGGGKHKRPAVDPFKSLIEPKVDISLPPTFIVTAPSAAPVIVVPPVQFTVSAIGEEKGERIALVDYQGTTYIVKKGEKVPPDQEPPAFSVTDIKETKVEVYDPKAMRRVVKELPLE